MATFPKTVLAARYIFADGKWWLGVAALFSDCRFGTAGVFSGFFCQKTQNKSDATFFGFSLGGSWNSPVAAWAGCGVWAWAWAWAGAHVYGCASPSTALPNSSSLSL